MNPDCGEEQWSDIFSDPIVKKGLDQGSLMDMRTV
jgi:hypothetical protein